MPTAPRIPSELSIPVPRSPLVGRSREAADLRRLLQCPEVSIVTVTGPPGIGKTRLALHVGAEIRRDFADGAYFVALAQLGDPGYLAKHIAEALGLPGDDNAHARVTSHLRQKQLLLLLDNFEHVIAAAPFVAELIAECPSLKVLATSREALRLSSEHEFPLPPMALPDAAELMPLQDLALVDAVAFFVQRATTVNPTFALSESNVSDVVAICRGLDGLPLAIELAAARTKLLSPAAIRARLANRLLLLTDGPRDHPPRQQSMHDAIAWSYDLLTPDEQAHLRRLSVFVGGFSPEGVERLVRAAEASHGGTPPQAPGLARRPFVPAPSLFRLGASLVDKSLVQPEADCGDQPRFRLLETIREFGLDRLAAGGEESTIRDAHAHAFLTLAETAHPHLRGPKQAAWFTELEAEHPNLRAALDWFQECGDLLSALRLANALARFWEARGHLSEGRDRLRRLLAAADQACSNAIPELVRARAELWSGTLAHWQGDFAESITCCSIAFNRYVASGDERGAAHALLRQGQSASFQGHLDRARSLMLESLRRFQALNDDWGIALARTAIVNPLLEAGDLASAEQHLIESLPLARKVADPDLLAMTLINVGWLASWRGEDARAEAALRESHDLFLMIGERRTLPYTLNLLGMLAWRHGNHARAASLLCEGLTLSRDLGSHLAIVNSLHGLMHVAATEQPALAARLHGAAETVRASIGNPIQPVERPMVDAAVDQFRLALGEETFRAEFAAGLTMSVDAAIAEGLSFLATLALRDQCAEPDLGDVSPTLTSRELDVLRHVVEGQTNSQIAAALFISHRTVRNHLSNIFAKLKVESRTAAAAYALRNNLV
jgi:predicted ATPase/DNA-binding CsgD family transcriptional regulator